MTKVARIILVAVTLIAGLGILPAAAEEETDNKGLMAALGRVTFNRYCASCHGEKADGTGPVAKMLKIPPTNLRMLALENDGEFPKERVTASVDGRTEVKTHGSRDMPVWGEVFQTPLIADPGASEEPGEDRANRKVRELVYYINTLQETAAAEDAESGED